MVKMDYAKAKELVNTAENLSREMDISIKRACEMEGYTLIDYSEALEVLESDPLTGA